MRRLLHLFFLFLGFYGYSQPWQQQVDYSIQCRLDDQFHRLEATMDIVYHNQSPDELHTLTVHTWMNTFNTTPTPYSNQLKELGLHQRFNLKSNEEGGYTALLFFYKGEELVYTFSDPTKEILILTLKESCKPGQTISLTARYTLNIPKNISRGGHWDQSYQMTQWYPKLALYDTAGWHAMHYLEFGEYYNEFGNYEVSIALPSNYLVASTGTLTSQEEKKFLIQYADSCQKKSKMPGYHLKKDFIPSNKEYKTVVYRAERVIDFAWFADKRFMVNHQTLSIGDKPVDLWAFFYPAGALIWGQATQYLSNAVQYFSELVGSYEYPQVTAVECPRAGSDAMEYPMITLIDKAYGQPLALERVIVHEVGHNWFQAVLATDERKQAWMDEGLVTYYEHRYFRDKAVNGFLSDAPFSLHTDYEKVTDLDWYIQANRNQDKPSSTIADQFTIRGYIQSVYEKPAKGLRLVEKALGMDRFDQFIRKYYNQWKFKHPQKADLLAGLEAFGVTWYDNLYIANAKKIDCSIYKLEQGSCFLLKHDATQTIPIELAGYRKNIKILSKMIQVKNDGDTICINIDSLDYLVLDPDFCLPEIHRTDNIYRINSSAYTPRKFALRFMAGIDHSLVTEMYVAPAIAYNFYDGLIAGVGLHNLTLPSKAFRFGGVLGYGFQGKKPVWLGGIDYSLFQNKRGIESLNFSLETRHFTFNRDTHYLFKDHYIKLAPAIKLNFKPGNRVSTRKQLSYRWIWINQWYGEGKNFETHLFENKKRNYAIHEFKYNSTNTRSIFPFEFNIVGELGQGLTKLYGNYKIVIPYVSSSKKHGEWYIFAGLQSIQASSKVLSSFLLNGLPGIQYFQRDYKMDELLLGRSEESNSFSQQGYQKDAAFKNLTNVGSSSSWMFASTFRSTIPGIIPLRPYIQGALIPGSYGQKIQFVYSTGVSLVLIPDILEFNFPALESKLITEGTVYQQRTSYLKKCTYMINLKAFNPFKWLDRVSN